MALNQALYLTVRCVGKPVKPPDYGGTVILLHIGLKDCADLIDGLQRLAACSDCRPTAQPNPALQA